MHPMPDAYTQLLDATLRHLEELQSRSVRFVPVSREALAELAKPASAKSSAVPAVPQVQFVTKTPSIPSAPQTIVQSKSTTASPPPTHVQPAPKPGPPPAAEMTFSLGLPGDAA
jgi:hypothetical protein